MQIGVETSKVVENKRVFVVDRDEITRVALQFMLHDENETHEFTDLDSALRKAGQLRPDLVILGAVPEPVSGPSPIARLKTDIAELKVLVVVEAGAADDAMLRPGGADGVLHKPLMIERTRKAVDVVLGRRRTTIAIRPI